MLILFQHRDFSSLDKQGDQGPRSSSGSQKTRSSSLGLPLPMEASCTSHMGPLKPILRTGCRACCLSPGCYPVALTFILGALPGRRGERSQLGVTPTRLQASGLAAPGHAALSDRSGFTWSVAGRGIRRPREGCCFKEVSLSSSGRSPRLFPGQAGSPHTKPDTPPPG